ncbi:MAG: glycine cleavage system protein GcvH [Bacteroidetes bacterium]|nr:MAG: glycine cleavage system protein GcvH [Bacteroidota bacterium]
MKIPENLFYTEDHEWVKVEGNHAVVGITDFAQKELGDIVYVEVETVGEKLEKGEVFGTVEAVKTVSDLFLPINGTIKELNDALDQNPELINNDPYGKGWMVKLEIEDDLDKSGLLNYESYKALIGA